LKRFLKFRTQRNFSISTISVQYYNITMPNFEVIFKHTYSDACVFCYFRGGKTVFYSADKIPAWERAWSDAWNRFCAYENNGSKYVFSYKRGNAKFLF